MAQAEEVYRYITEEGEERSCSAISEAQCTDVPGNFLKNALSGFCSKLAEQLVSPGVTLPWMISLFGGGIGISGMLVPLKNLGSLLPQLFVSGRIRNYPRRKYFWAFPAFFQALVILLIGGAFWKLEGGLMAGAVAVLLLLFSIASGVASVAFKDVMGKTIPKGRRGRLLATRATGGGLLTLAFGLVLFFFLRDMQASWTIALLIVGAALLWVLAGLAFLSIDEAAGATEGGRTPFQEFRAGWKVLRKDRNLSNFILSRAFLMAIPLAQPYFVVIGREYTDADLSGLGLFVIAAGLAALISSPLWGKMADRSSRGLMVGMALLGILNCGLVAGFTFLPEGNRSIYLFAPLILLNMMAHGGARLSRKTYLTDYAPEEDRPLYVALANTLIGFFTLAAAGIGFLSEWFGPMFLLAFLSGMLLVSIFFSWRLEET